MSWFFHCANTTFADGNPTLRELLTKTQTPMKQFFKISALMVVLLMAIVTATDAKTLTYDFMTNHPSTTIRIDQGYKENYNSKVYWSGEWSGLFGRKIAFDPTSAYPSLRGEGGLCDYHDHQKMYVMNLSPGDYVTFYYTGDNAALQFHVSSTCTMQSLVNNFDPIASGTAYRVTGAGDLCVLNKWKLNEAETIITKIVITTASNTETVDVSHGLSTYCSKNPLDFSNNTNLKAYVATKYSDGKFIFKQVDYVPSQTGFLIVYQGGSATEVTVDIGRSSDYRENYISTNLFRGELTAKTIGYLYGYSYYIFAEASGNVGIYKMNSNLGFSCGANKAYLMVQTKSNPTVIQ